MVNCPWRLELADGQRWTFAAGMPLQTWLDKFAAVLKLKRHEHPHPTASLTFHVNRGAEHPPGIVHDSGFVTIWAESGSHDWHCRFNQRRGRRRDIYYIQHALTPVFQEAIRRWGFLVHAGLIERNGQGILITGPSGTGKSTLCRRLANAYQIRCDEETLIVRNQQGCYRGHPFPTWSHLLKCDDLESWPVQQALPISHIFFIFPDRKYLVTPIGPGETSILMTRAAFGKSLRGFLDTNNDAALALKERVFQNVCNAAAAIPACRFHVSLAGDIEEEFEKACLLLDKKLL